MENKDFKLISIDRFQQINSKTSRIISVIIYGVLIAFFCFHLFDNLNKMLIFPKILFIIFDIIAIVVYSLVLISHIINRDIFFKPVYIEITKDLIKYRKTYKKEVVISKVQIEYIRIINNQLIFKTHNKKKFYFNINIFENTEKGHLKFKLQEFCNLNDIEFRPK